MQVRVGLFGPNLHKEGLHTWRVKAAGGLSALVDNHQARLSTHVKEVAVRSLGDRLEIEAGGRKIAITPGAITLSAPGAIAVSQDGQAPRQYKGTLTFSAQAPSTVVLSTHLEDYVRGVLRSEIPASYHLEAMKAQAILARTYGLHPRVDHSKDQINVCDSFLCCQAFDGITALSARQDQAIAQTAGKLLLYQGKPALALFSACAGGHTESYDNCFSDVATGAFPPPPIPYLTGVSEGTLPAGYPDERALQQLFNTANPATYDGWSKSFRWTVELSAGQLEAHMHHVFERMHQDPAFKDFIQAPESGRFGHIDSFETGKRGCAGTLIDLSVHTNTGTWVIRKELVIRSIFANPEVGIKRLRSARFLLESRRDNLGLLASIKLSGFGSGHGVGLQQVGAEGMARAGKNSQQILAHYYPGATVGTL